MSVLHPLSSSPAARAALGLGCATFGREIDAAAAFALMDHAAALGITYFDTAPAYGDGASERIVGDWLAARPDAASTRVGTKVKPPYTAAAIAASVDRSRRRLRRDRLDLLFFHQWDPGAAQDEALTTLGALAGAGSVAAFGASNLTLAQLGLLRQRQAALGSVRFEAIQNNQNVAVRDVDRPLRSYCDEHHIAVLTYSPLGAGFLTGKHRARVEPGSRFAVVPGHQDVYFQPEPQRRLDRLHHVAERSGYSPTVLALAWALHQPGVAMVLSGGRTTAHLDQAIHARGLDLGPVLAELDA